MLVSVRNNLTKSDLTHEWPMSSRVQQPDESAICHLHRNNIRHWNMLVSCLLFFFFKPLTHWFKWTQLHLVDLLHTGKGAAPHESQSTIELAGCDLLEIAYPLCIFILISDMKDMNDERVRATSSLDTATMKRRRWNGTIAVLLGHKEPAREKQTALISYLSSLWEWMTG
jgi:hypothetical protein